MFYCSTYPTRMNAPNTVVGDIVHMSKLHSVCDIAHEKTTTTKCKRTYACDTVISEPKGLGGSNIRSVSQGTVRTFSMRAEGSLCGT